MATVVDAGMRANNGDCANELVQEVDCVLQRRDEEIEEAKEAEEEETFEEEQGWIDLLGSGELFRKIIRNGEGSREKPQKNQVVTVRVKGTLEEDGRNVDIQDSLKFQLGHLEVIQALELCVQAMSVGEMDLIKTSSRFAYGSIGNEQVPPGANIVYEMELCSVDDGPDLYSMSPFQRLTCCEKKKDLGNYYFRRKEYDQAIQVYKRALSILDVDLDKDDCEKECLSQIQKLAADLTNNTGAAQLKIEAWTSALDSFNMCLEMDAENVKALFRCGKALSGMGEYEKALEILKKACHLAPTSALIAKEFCRVQKRVDENIRKERKLYSRMFRNNEGSDKSLEKKWNFTVKICAGALISLAVGVALYFVL